MSKLELVKIVKVDGFDPSYSIVTLDGFDVRTGIANYRTAVEIAERIDATMIYERDNGADSLQTV